MVRLIAHCTVPALSFTSKHGLYHIIIVLICFHVYSATLKCLTNPSMRQSLPHVQSSVQTEDIQPQENHSLADGDLTTDLDLLPGIAKIEIQICA